jgi:hypothetical protein
MDDQIIDRRGLMPVIVAVIVAVVGMTAILLSHFGPGLDSQAGNSGMITAAAASRAGAIVIPSQPRATDGVGRAPLSDVTGSIVQ